jgi:hypothetical protein
MEIVNSYFTELNRVTIRGLEFEITHNLNELSQNTDIQLQRINLLKMIICSGFYPNIALPDEHNLHRKSHEQVYHTSSKNFVLVHPSSVYSTYYEIMIKKPSSPDQLFSTNDELLCYVQLLEINKPYLIHSIRVPALPTCLLFSY